MPQISNEDMYIFNELKARFRQQSHVRFDGPDPAHRGVIDSGYVRDGHDVKEFPKMIYRESKRDPKGYTTRIIESLEEQAAAIKQGWLTATKEIHSLLERLAAERNGVTSEAAN